MNVVLDFAWAYLALLEKCRYVIWTASLLFLLPLLLSKFGWPIPAIVLKLSWWTNVALLVQFLLFLCSGLAIASIRDKNFYYLVFNLFLLSWPYALFCTISFFIKPAAIPD